jgi:hypothetical protein
MSCRFDALTVRLTRMTVNARLRVLEGGGEIWRVRLPD